MAHTETERDDGMSGSEEYRELIELTKNRDSWEEKIPYVAELLSREPVRIKAKAEIPIPFRFTSVIPISTYGRQVSARLVFA